MNIDKCFEFVFKAKVFVAQRCLTVLTFPQNMLILLDLRRHAELASIQSQALFIVQLDHFEASPLVWGDSGANWRSYEEVDWPSERGELD